MQVLILVLAPAQDLDLLKVLALAQVVALLQVLAVVHVHGSSANAISNSKFGCSWNAARKCWFQSKCWLQFKLTIKRVQVLVPAKVLTEVLAGSSPCAGSSPMAGSNPSPCVQCKYWLKKDTVRPKSDYEIQIDKWIANQLFIFHPNHKTIHCIFSIVKKKQERYVSIDFSPTIKKAWLLN